MRVLITGASSLIGRTVAAELSSRGDQVTCFQRSPSATGLDEILGDITDRGTVLAAARNHDAIVHLAALVAPKPSLDQARAVNVEGTRNVIEAAEACGRLLHVSSPSVAFDDRPAMGVGAEPATYAGGDAYARTKAEAERLVLSTSRVPTVIIRPHLVWGPGDTQLVGRIIDRARRGILVLPDRGRALVATTFVDDAARAIVAGLDRTADSDEAIGRAWVVTGDDPRPLRELIAGILAAAGVECSIRSVPAPLASLTGRAIGRLWPGDEPPLTHFAARQLSVAHWFDQREVQRVLQWRPEVSVDEGLARLAASFASDQPIPNVSPEA